VRVGQRLGQRAVMAEEEIQSELLLAGKVSVDRSFGDRCRHGDLLGRRLGDAARHEQRERGTFDPRLGFLGLPHQAILGGADGLRKVG
jgi:hypothetical protein